MEGGTIIIAMMGRHLRDPRVSLAEVAFLLGYSGPSPFQNAFRRWLGDPPGIYGERVLLERTEVVPALA